MVFRCDPCGLLCLCFTYLIIGYADYVVVLQLILPVLKSSPAAVLNVVGFNTVAFLLTFSHLCAVFGDPGLIPLGQYPINQINAIQRPVGWTTCTKCGMYRPPRAHHCRICHRCVRRMDHHCPWINNCVGEYNQKYFIMFLIYVAILCIYALIIVVVCRAALGIGTPISSSSSSSLHLSSPSSSNEANPIVVAHMVALVAICCLFGLFVFAILSDQYKAIVEDETAIEALQNRVRPSIHDAEIGYLPRRLSKSDLFREVFGGAPMYLWLLPCPFLFKSSKSNNSFPMPNPYRIEMTTPSNRLVPDTTNDDLSGTDSSTLSSDHHS
ncbi:unnamed protein product [Calicophoron daubneyi]|uniref:Palmitoyltransferase n=1 Tax=Calicophoron daubneyi TaxID=300641 RepID=A0AAV2SYQ5_CALDB